MMKIAGGDEALIGREAEIDNLRAFLDREVPGLALIRGPRGTGKTSLLARALEGRRALHFQALPLPPEGLLADLEGLLRSVLGEVPRPGRPGLLPLTTPEARWEALLSGLADRAGESGPLVLALDGAENLFGAHRKWLPLLSETLLRVREGGVPLTVLAAGGPGMPHPPDPELTLELGPLPFRVAGWTQGAGSPGEAFVRWAVFGDHPAHLPERANRRNAPGRGTRGLEDAVISRVLDPGGHLYDRPLRTLERTFQRPARYLALLRALAEGPLDWAGLLARTPGVEAGGQLAPYLRRLEEEGFVRAERPLDAEEGSRNRRYVLTDPFMAFWCGLVLPHRSLLSGEGPEAVWRERIRPTLAAHLDRWLARAALLWLRNHAAERLPAPARTVGALWGGEADFDAVAWLENGQVCYGLARWSEDPVEGPDLPDEMARRMKETRYGIGRESRAPVWFLPGGAGEELRRRSARDPLGRILGLGDLMGEGPPQ
jgi:AAA+ ATPase superfamily predicted ATPase